MAKNSNTTKAAIVKKAKPTKTKSSSSPKKKKGGSGGGSAKDRIMSALAQKHNVNDKAPTRKQICSMAGIKNMKSFMTSCSALKTQGSIEYPCGKTLALSAQGLEEVDGELAEAPTTNDAAQETMKEMITQKKGRDLFELLTDGSTRSYAELAEHVGHDDVKNKSFLTYVSSLSKCSEKVTGPNGEKMLKLNDDAFPFGRPTTEG